tara:strand:+ start:3835 stop:4983 length:1149 start_codon:yes stop_codon:yes gene_type:complete
MDNNGFLEAGVSANRFLYQGKEWQTELGLNLYDFHARQFDPSLGRWLANDPQNQFASPYLGMGNMPNLSIDPDGEFALIPAIFLAAKLIGYGTTAVNTIKAIGAGDWKRAGLTVGMSALGGLASNGVDAVIGKATGLLPELGRAALNGVSSASLGALTGGDFGSGFLRGATISLASSGLKGIQGAGPESSNAGDVDLGDCPKGWNCADLGSVTIEDARDGFRGIYGWGNLSTVNSYYGTPAATNPYRGAVDAMNSWADITSNALLTVAPLPKIGLLSKIGGRIGNSFKGGKTFSQYKAKYWKGRVKPKLDPIRGTSPRQVWIQHTELHHRFIPQRAKWAPNWLKNNSLNLQPLSSLEHALRDPYRARFAPRWVKDAYKLKWK